MKPYHFAVLRQIKYSGVYGFFILLNFIICTAQPALAVTGVARPSKDNSAGLISQISQILARKNSGTLSENERDRILALVAALNKIKLAEAANGGKNGAAIDQLVLDALMAHENSKLLDSLTPEQKEALVKALNAKGGGRHYTAADLQNMSLWANQEFRSQLQSAIQGANGIDSSLKNSLQIKLAQHESALSDAQRDTSSMLADIKAENTDPTTAASDGPLTRDTGSDALNTAMNDTAQRSDENLVDESKISKWWNPFSADKAEKPTAKKAPAAVTQTAGLSDTSQASRSAAPGLGRLRSGELTAAADTGVADAGTADVGSTGNSATTSGRHDRATTTPKVGPGTGGGGDADKTYQYQVPLSQVTGNANQPVIARNTQQNLVNEATLSAAKKNTHTPDLASSVIGADVRDKRVQEYFRNIGNRNLTAEQRRTIDSNFQAAEGDFERLRKKDIETQVAEKYAVGRIEKGSDGKLIDRQPACDAFKKEAASGYARSSGQRGYDLAKQKCDASKASQTPQEYTNLCAIYWGLGEKHKEAINMWHYFNGFLNNKRPMHEIRRTVDPECICEAADSTIKKEYSPTNGDLAAFERTMAHVLLTATSNNWQYEDLSKSNTSDNVSVCKAQDHDPMVGQYHYRYIDSGYKVHIATQGTQLNDKTYAYPTCVALGYADKIIPVSSLKNRVVFSADTVAKNNQFGKIAESLQKEHFAAMNRPDSCKQHEWALANEFVMDRQRPGGSDPVARYWAQINGFLGQPSAAPTLIDESKIKGTKPATKHVPVITERRRPKNQAK